MEKQKQMHSKIIKQFDELFGRNLPIDNSCMLYRGDGFMDLVINIIHESETDKIISMGHYFVQEGLPYPDPLVHFRVDRENSIVTPMVFKNMIQQTRNERGKDLSEKIQDDLRQYLFFWLNNIMMQGYSLVENSPKWIRQPQEKEEQYVFTGKVVFTRGFIDLLSPFEMFSILVDLEAFILQKKTVDYLQVYEKQGSDDRIFCIDQLNVPMKQSGEFDAESDYCTFLLPSEY